MAPADEPPSGVDGVIAVAGGAGGHTGTINPFALMNEVRQLGDHFAIVLAGGQEVVLQRCELERIGPGNYQPAVLQGETEDTAEETSAAALESAPREAGWDGGGGVRLPPPHLKESSRDHRQ